MPTYCYISEDGEKHEVVRSIDQKPPPVLKLDGKTFHRDYQSEMGCRKVADPWPLYSEAVGVHPEQKVEAEQAAVKAGVPTQFTEDGRAVFTSRSHRRTYLRAFGLRDNDGGYSD